jgi:hypothetical protein
MKVKRKYSHTLPKGSRQRTEYSGSRARDYSNVNSNDSNNLDLKNSIPTDKLGVDYKRPEPYTYCDICNWNGYPYEKIVVRNFRIRSEDEEGFIYEFDTFDYDPDISCH